MSVLKIAGQTDVGRHRQDNQDAFITSALWSVENALLGVIDGVGGYAGGAEAAALAKEAIAQYMTTPNGDTLTMLREAVVHANNQIVRQRSQDAALNRMCCVLTVAVADVQARKLYYVHVGDTRLYRFRQQQLEKLTHDHSLVGVREDAQQLTEQEAMRHPRRNEILRDVGSAMHRVDDADFLESGEADFFPGDTVLLCSDGLTDMLTREQLTSVLSLRILVQEQVAELVRLANEYGGQDNITVVLAQYPAESGQEIPHPAPTPGRVTPESVAEASPGVEPVPATARLRKLVYGIVVFLLLLMLAGILWWQSGTMKATSTPPAVSADSSDRGSTFINQPNSGQTP